MMKIKFCFFFIAAFVFTSFTCEAQNKSFAKQTVDTLAAPGMHGRGYVSDGDKTAATYIKNEFKKAGAQPFSKGFYQEYSFPVNTFPNTMSLELGSQSFIPGQHFLMHPASSSIKGKYDIVWLDKYVINDENQLKTFQEQNWKNKFLMVDTEGVEDEKWLKVMESVLLNPLGARGIIVFTTEKFTHFLSMEQVGHPIIYLKKAAPYTRWKTVKIEVDAELIKKYTTQNIIGYIPGTVYPDSFIVFSAHYDHLGRMGKDTYFPGANDNASGTAMILDLANHYATNPSKYSVAFIAFGAEEIGLIGSKFFVENPYFPLNSIKFLLNMDIMGTGDEGITVVNATEHPNRFEQLQKINDEKDYLAQVKKRGKSSNSDHYWFTEEGVPAFFIYTMGGIKAYHDIWDKASTLPLTEYEDCFRLLTDFVHTFEQ